MFRHFHAMRLGPSPSGRAFSVNPVTAGLEAWDGRRREGCVRDMTPSRHRGPNSTPQIIKK